MNHTKQKNNLLYLWGSIGQEALYLLNQLNILSEKKSFKLLKTDSVLHILQKKILECDDNQLNFKEEAFNLVHLKSIQKNILKKSDQSITIHACYNIHREIEVLHNNLLLMLDRDPHLLPHDIIVMAPNIRDYVSSIQTVFNNVFNRQLPFSISGNHTNYINPVISSILNILNLSNSRFTSEEVLSFLSIPSIAAKFNINDEEVKLLHSWVIESGIRWGLDNKTMLNFNLPITDQNTWYFGFRRILLGYALHNQHDLWKNISPYNHNYTGIDKKIDIISKLGEFLEKLRKWRDRLSYSYKLDIWQLYFREVINDFFDYQKLNEEENQALLLLQTHWIDLINSGIQSKYFNSVNITVLRDKLILKLGKYKAYYKFLPNVINFCDMTPICCIPCKILCIIGMNDNDFPRSQLIYNFNLIAKKKRYGDDNIQERDRYSFLLACLLPKKKIYFSYIDKSMASLNNIDSPSRLINELLEYIAQNFCLMEDQDLDIENNLKNIRNHLLQKYSYVPFDSVNFNSNTKKNQSFSNEWLCAARIAMSSSNTLSNFNTFLPSISTSTILFHDLYDFYRHPTRMWFQKRLKVYFCCYKNNMLLNDEVFSVNDLNRFELNKKLINYLVNNKNTDLLYQESYASGVLPYGSFGKVYWIEQCQRMNKLASQIKMYYSEKIFNLKISLKFKTVKLVGQLNAVHQNGLIRWKPSSLSMKDYFLMWLEHLIYCATGGDGDSRLFGIDNMWHFPNLSKLDAKNLLFSLISGYCLGMNTPLILLYKSGGVWINHVFDWKNKVICLDEIVQKKAHQKLVQTWQGSNSSNKYFYQIGESQDPYLRKLVPFYLNEENIQIITQNAKYYFLNVMKHRIS